MCNFIGRDCDSIRHVEDFSRRYDDYYCHYIVNNIIQETPKFIPFITSITENYFVDFDAINDHDTIILLYENNPDHFLHLEETNIEKIFDMISYMMDIGDGCFHDKIMNHIVQCDYLYTDDKIKELIHECTMNMRFDDDFIPELLIECHRSSNLRVTKLINSFYMGNNETTENDIIEMVLSDDEEGRLAYLEYYKPIISIVFSKSNDNCSDLKEILIKINDNDLNIFFKQFTNSICRFQSCPSCRTNLTLKPYKLFIETTSKCVICLCTIDEPHALECGHVYCKECLF